MLILESKMTTVPRLRVAAATSYSEYYHPLFEGQSKTQYFSV